MATSPEISDYRLPTTVVPRRYGLRLAPDLEQARFDGDERIELDVLEPTDTIVLNAIELEIHSAVLHAGWDAPRDATGLTATYDLDEPSERLTVHVGEELPPGRYSLDLTFSGILNDKLCGFYRSTYRDEDGEEHVIATTQFEDTDARRAFPCFDEPDKKAVFGITLDVPPGLFAVSNSSEVSEELLDGGVRRVVFADTIAMSTYIVAFVVGPLEATEVVEAEGVKLRVVHVPGKGHLTAPALDCAAHSLRFFRDYFGIPYPSDKLDLVALPDFAAGAMENLGCVTFREAIVLADPASSSRTELQRLAEVVEHEIAHMWFGDLVTMGWWNGIWLNEAFATFMSLRCQDDYRPEWNCFVGFSRDRAGAFAIDGLHSTRPIEFPVRLPEEAAAMFDVLTYEKGAGVLWMLESYVGQEAFRNGVRRYLAAHLYGNTETTDLWDAIEAEAPDDAIRQMMDSWIFQGGYPLVQVEEAADGALQLHQQPFAYLAEAPADSAIGSDWLVPVLWRNGESEGKLLLGSEAADLKGPGAGTVFNAGGTGFYRVRYSPSLLAALTGGLDDLQAGERYNLAADLWASSLAGIGELVDFFDLVGRLGEEREPDVWSVIIGAFGTLDRVVAADDRPMLAAYVRGVLRPQFDKVGWTAKDDEGEQIPLLRSSLVSALGTIGDDAEVIARARELFVANHERQEPIDPDLSAAVLTVVNAHATRAEFEAVIERFRKPVDPMDQVRHLYSLASLTDTELAAEVHEMCRDEVRSQNAPYLLAGLLRGREVGGATWSFIHSHYEELAARFPANSIHRMLDGIAWLVEIDETGNAPIIEELRSFLDANIEPARRRLVDQSLERLQINVAFARRERNKIAGLLGSH